MTQTELENRLMDIVCAQKKTAPGVLTRATALADIGVDSLDGLSIMFAIEEQFDISISDEQARAITTFGDMIDTVAALVPEVT